MALDSSRLGTALKPVIEAKIRAYVIDGDSTPYPELTEFSKALAEAIAEKVVQELVTNAALNNAKFSGTFAGTVAGAACSTTITNHPVTGGII